jgi:hypothetical protein
MRPVDFLALSIIFCAGSSAIPGNQVSATPGTSSTEAVVAESTTTEAVMDVTVCQLLKDTEAYNHKLVRVSGRISRGMEDFSIVDRGCHVWPAIWLEYGGTKGSGTQCVCGMTGLARPSPLRVEGIETSLVQDAKLRMFDELTLRRLKGGFVRATLVGRYFGGKLDPDILRRMFSGQDPKSLLGVGRYGHMGVHTLLVIQQVSDIQSD